MQVSKTTNVTLPASASWRIEKFSLLELFKTIENEYTALIPASENYRTTVVVCRDISDETRYTLEEFKKYFSDSAPFKSITLLCTNALEESAYLYLDTKSILYKTPYQCYISISSSSLTEAEAEDFLKKMTALAIPFLSEPNAALNIEDSRIQQAPASKTQEESRSGDDSDTNHDSPNSKHHKKRTAFWNSADKVDRIIGIIVGVLAILSFFGIHSCTQHNDNLKNQTSSVNSEADFT